MTRRALAKPFVVGPPGAVSIRTRVFPTPRGRGGAARGRRALTPRWAGTITRTADDMWEREFNNLEDMVKRDRREVSELDRRLALPVGEGKPKKRGYATRSERFQKARRRQKLAARLADTEKRVEDGRVSITVGGKGLARKRHNLEDAGLTLEE